MKNSEISIFKPARTSMTRYKVITISSLCFMFENNLKFESEMSITEPLPVAIKSISSRNTA